MAVTLTKKFAEDVKCGVDAGGRPKETTVWDAPCRGLGLRIMPSGHKSWIVTYRLVGSRQAHKVVLGACTDLTLAQARDLASEYRVAARKGINLRTQIKDATREREAAQKAKADLISSPDAVAAYLEAYENAPSRRSGRLIAASTIKSARNNLRELAALNKPLEDVVEQDITAMLDGKTQALQHTRFAHVRRFFKWATKKRLVKHDPTALLDVPPAPPAREACPTPEEVHQIISAANKLVAEKKLAPVFADLISIVTLTGCRRGEAAGMRWEDVDLTKAVWEQPSFSNKSRRIHRVPLAPKVFAILKARWEAAGRPTAGLCMPGPRSGGNASSTLGAVMHAIRVATGLPYRLHDQRRGTVSGLADAGVPIAVADALLNHAATSTRAGVIAVYQRSEQLPQRREALELWEQLVFASETVIPSKRSA